MEKENVEEKKPSKPRKIPWDKYEAAILLDACLRVEAGEYSRDYAVAHVSATLRKRAKIKGMDIDSVFIYDVKYFFTIE